jgi:hypothetical protein
MDDSMIVAYQLGSCMQTLMCRSWVSVATRICRLHDGNSLKMKSHCLGWVWHHICFPKSTMSLFSMVLGNWKVLYLSAFVWSVVHLSQRVSCLYLQRLNNAFDHLEYFPWWIGYFFVPFYIQRIATRIVKKAFYH